MSSSQKSGQLLVLIVLIAAIFVCGSQTIHAADAPPKLAFKPTAQATIVPTGARVELLWNEGEFTEGPLPTVDGNILFSDIGNRILSYDPKTKMVTTYREPSGKANGLKFYLGGNLVACEGAGPGG